MNIQIVLSFLAFVGGAGLLSIYKSRSVNTRTSIAFFLGNRSLGFWMIGCSLFLTNMSANQFIGENEFVFSTNMSVMCWGLSSIFAMVIVAEYLMPVYLRIGAVTTPDFLEIRFDRQTKMLVSVVFLLSYIVNLVPSVLYGCAVAINEIFHIDRMFGLSYFNSIRVLTCFIGVVGALYTLLGGLKTIVISDTIQGVGMVAGAICIAWFGFRKVGDGNMAAGVVKVLSTHREHLNAIGGPHDAIPLGTLFTGMLLINLYYWGMEQYIVQEALASKSLAAGQKGIALACAGKLAAPLLLNIPGLIAIQLYSHIDNTATVFPRLVADILPPVLTGFIAAMVFGGALSTFNAGVNSLGTLFVMNIYKPVAERRYGAVSDGRLLRVGKGFQLAVIIGAICLSPYILFFQGGFYNYLQKVSSYFSVPVFTVMVVGLLSRRVPAVAAKFGLLFFISVYVLTQTVMPTGLHYLHVLALLFVVTVGLMFLIGRFLPARQPVILADRAMVSLQPWKRRYWYFGILLILMVLFFVLFSPLGFARV